MFEVIPAIDVSNGRLARLTARGAVPVESFGGDPLAAAAAFVAAGVPRLHVVDLDLAIGGQHRNLDVVRDVSSLGTPVQASGAAATAAEVELLLGTGAARAVLGSAALADRALVTELAERLGERLAIGIETDGPRVRARGRRTVDLPLAETLEWLAGTAAQRFVVTALPHVGLLSGPDLDRIRAVAALGRRTVAAGGVATQADIEAVRASGAEGVVVGRAVLDGSIDLATALAAASGAAGGGGGAGG